MHDPFWVLVLVILLALIFDFTNGWHDTANAVATVIGTRALHPGKAIFMAAILNLVGAFFSTAVAKTIGKDIVQMYGVTQIVLIAALLSVIIWNIVTVFMGLPTSSSHALIGSLVGSALAYKGFAVLQSKGIIKILIGLLISPILGSLIAFMLMKLIKKVFQNTSPSKVKQIFRRLQIVSSGYLAFSHGTADAQKAMGIITLALVTAGYQKTMNIPLWVVVSAGLAMALGTAMGGMKIIHTVGSRLSRLDPPQGFAAEASAATLLATVSSIGLPVSTTHTITGSVIGVGSAERIRSVRWSIAGKIVYAWVLTLPGTMIMGYVLYMILRILE